MDRGPNRRLPYRVLAGLYLAGLAASGQTAPLASCQSAASTFVPCELTYALTAADGAPVDTYRSNPLQVEFRSVHAGTFLIPGFSDDGLTIHVRFAPVEEGQWFYRVSSRIKRLEGQEGSFQARASGKAGFVTPANLRHWWTADKRPHLWLSAEVPWSQFDAAAFLSWARERKQEGFTHVRVAALTVGGKLAAFGSSGAPNAAYFAALDERLVDADALGLTIDLVVADESAVTLPPLASHEGREQLVRLLCARYAALNLDWQGLMHFERLSGGRDTLRDLGELLMRYDVFRHPRSTDAVQSAAVLQNDNWLNFMIEASPRPDLAAVEHQFTRVPMIHVVNATEPAELRRELWTSTTNGEYPTISYQALENQANRRAVAVWARVMAGTRHWDLEPYFDVDNATALGLEEVEYVAYTDQPGVVEVSLTKHKYNPAWVDPATGAEEELKNFKGEVFSQEPPGKTHDWVLLLPREGHKEAMLRSFKFESRPAPEQEPETDPARVPFTIAEPEGEVRANEPVPFKATLKRPSRATRLMRYVWVGDVPGANAGEHILATGANGRFKIPQAFLEGADPNLHLRVACINAFGKAYILDRVYRLVR